MISVVVADDSALVRRLVTGILNDAPDISVAGVARDGADAIEKVAQLAPDLLTLDIEMPVMDGLAAMRELHRRFPRLPVIMLSTLTQRGAIITLDALAAGARDYVTKPTNSASLADSLDELGRQLIPRIRALTQPRIARKPEGAQATLPAATTPPAASARPAMRRGERAGVGLRRDATDDRKAPRSRPARAATIVAIGSSTGGPDALARVLGAFDQRPAVPLVAVQHMPPVFTTMLAQRLDRIGPTTVVEAVDGQALEPGVLYLAPGGRHMEVARRGGSLVAVVRDGEAVNYSRPSVDVLFRSVAQACPGSAVAVMLTGMGHDGRDGTRELAEGGSMVIAQDQPTAVVWGMPGAVVDAGLADIVLPVDHIGPALVQQMRHLAGVP